MGLQEKWDNMLGLVTGTNDPVTLKAVIEVQKEMSQLLQENQELRQEIHDLKNVQILRSEVKKIGNTYYKGEESPFCTNCFDTKGILVHLILDPEVRVKVVVGRCPNCKTDKIETNVLNENWKKEIEDHQRYLSEFRKIFH